MQSLTPSEHSFNSHRLQIAYAQWGHDQSRKIVLVHGGRDQKRSWDWVARELLTGYNVYAVDLRGHGRSDWTSDGSYNVMDHVADLATLIDNILMDDVILIGHSLGGNIALRYTGMFPERVKKLVAIEGLGPSPSMIKKQSAIPIQTHLRKWIERRQSLANRTPRIMANQDEAESRMRAAFSHLSDVQISHLTQTGLRKNEDETVSWAYDPSGTAPSALNLSIADQHELWKLITCPTWLVYGADSWASNPAQDGRAAHFKNAEVNLIDNAGHWLHHDQYEIFMTRLKRFLAQ